VRAVAQGLSGDMVYDDHDVIIGADDDVGAIQVFWPGRIDEVHIFDRALEPAEIAELSKP
jgi:Concanavalin A-like lectin/glucanases superfamily